MTCAMIGVDAPVASVLTEDVRVIVDPEGASSGTR
jgi:hypothetical protein